MIARAAMGDASAREAPRLRQAGQLGGRDGVCAVLLTPGSWAHADGWQSAWCCSCCRARGSPHYRAPTVGWGVRFGGCGGNCDALVSADWRTRPSLDGAGPRRERPRCDCEVRYEGPSEFSKFACRAGTLIRNNARRADSSSRRPSYRRTGLGSGLARDIAHSGSSRLESSSLNQQQMTSRVGVGAYVSSSRRLLGHPRCHGTPDLKRVANEGGPKRKAVNMAAMRTIEHQSPVP